MKSPRLPFFNHFNMLRDHAQRASHGAIFYIIALFFNILISSPALAAEPPPEIVHASMVSDTTALEPGHPFTLGILLEPKSGWHTYWENPGDAGIPTSLHWTLPPGFSAAAPQWPAPQRLVEGPLVVFAYPGKIVVPVSITPPQALNLMQNYSFAVKAEWLVCKDICIPESATLDVTLPAGKARPSDAHAIFTSNKTNQPIIIHTPARYAFDDKTISFFIPTPELGMTDIKKLQFFPRQGNIIDNTAEPVFSVQNGQLQIALPRLGETPTADLSGLIALENSSHTKKIMGVTFHQGTAPAAANHWLPVTLFLALLGGLILNLMPCVLPILSLKALSIARNTGAARHSTIRHGIAYTAGILLSFAALAIILITLQHAGHAIGWGFQMQSPSFIGSMIYLLFLVGLNLSGAFDVRVLLGGVAIQRPHSLAGSFLTAILATAVATPCTAPFMASAIGIALGAPDWQALLIFESLGLGLALPFLLISFYPQALRVLPKPGAWMQTLRQLLAFPIYASVLWLLWVLTQQIGANGMVIASAGMLAILFTLWIKSLFPQSATACRIGILAIGAGLLIASLFALNQMQAMPESHIKSGEISYSPEKLSQLRASGKPVFIDATAAWCITCQLNSRLAIHTTRTMDAFKTNHITLMVADWTRQDENITALLASFGYQGVPLYVYYPAQGTPIILPQLLSPERIISTIEGKP